MLLQEFSLIKIFLYPSQDDPHCESNQFACDGKCHPMQIKCNGVDECLDGLDEENCPENEPPRPPLPPVIIFNIFFIRI